MFIKVFVLYDEKKYEDVINMSYKIDLTNAYVSHIQIVEPYFYSTILK